MATTEEKYQFLLSKLSITDVDLWEGDAMIELLRPLYFQFEHGGPADMDACVEAALQAHKEFPND